MTTVSIRLAAAIKARSTNPNALESASGVDQSTIQRIVDGYIRNPKQPTLLKLARGLPCNAVWLQTGHGNMDEANPTHAGRIAEPLPQAYNVAPPDGLSQSPIIEWGEAAMWQELRGDTTVVGAKQQVWSERVRASDGSFWLRVMGDLMVSAKGVSYPDGTLILVDPEVEPTRDRFVLARDPYAGGAVFRKLVSDGSNWYLVPLNSQYPSMLISSLDASIIGVCVEYKPPGGTM